MKRYIALFMALVLIASAFASCSSKKSEVVFAYGEASLNENLYFYELAMMKTQLLQEYTGASTDLPALWTQPIGEGITFDDYAYAQCQINISTVLFFADYAIKNGVELGSEDKKTIDNAIDDIVSKFGSKVAVNKYLETYTIDLKMYREYLELYALYNKGLSLAFSETGDYVIGYDEVHDYYEKNFVTVKHIAIGTEYAGTDEAGNFIYYTDEEKKEKRNTINEIMSALERGEDFDKYYSMSEDKQSENYPDGYTITQGVMGETMKGYETLALSLEVGEWDTFELEGTSVYIIKRVDLLEEHFNNCSSTIMSILAQKKMVEAVLDNHDNLVMNQDIIDSYFMAMIPVVK